MARKLAYRKHWPRKTLGELLNFLEDLHPEGLTLKGLSDELGMNVGAISNIFNRDDLKLSKAEEIVRTYGYELRLFFPVKTYPVGIERPQYSRTFENAGNLTGLARFIYDSNWTIHSVSKSIGVYTTTLTNAFESGDIQLSRLYQITDLLGICFFWKYEKITGDTEGEKTNDTENINV